MLVRNSIGTLLLLTTAIIFMIVLFYKCNHKDITEKFGISTKYSVNEAKNWHGPNKCTSTLDCDGLRQCLGVRNYPSGYGKYRRSYSYGTCAGVAR